MVARGPHNERRLAAGINAVFHRWQQLLSALGPTLREAVRRSVPAGTAALHSVTRSIDTAHHLVLAGPTVDVAAAHAVGMLALVLGVTLAGAIGVTTGSPIESLTSGAAGALWVAIRLMFMRLASPNRATEDDVTRAWAAGAIAYAIAATPTLRFASWLLGGYLTWRTLRLAQVPIAEARRIVAWGYGVEAIATGMIWAMGTAIIAALFLV